MNVFPYSLFNVDFISTFLVNCFNANLVIMEMAEYILF